MAKTSPVAKAVSKKKQLQQDIENFHKLVDGSADTTMNLGILSNVLVSNHRDELDDESVEMLEMFYKSTKWIYRLNVQAKVKAVKKGAN